MRSSEDGIYFEETSGRAADFLHELTDPRVVRAGELAPEVAAELRVEQVHRLRRNVSALRAKQREFNQRIDEYVRNLEALIGSLHRAGGAAARLRGVGGGERDAPGGRLPSTRVTCTRCEREEVFEGIRVVFARESDESLDAPTECYISDRGRLKKGIFRCRDCGGHSLTIRLLADSGRA